MDEDDSQDELINRRLSQSKGKRAAVWVISDESDNVEEESEEGESDSGEEEEEDHLDGEDDDEEEDDDDDDDDEEEEEEEDEEEDGTKEGDAKAEDGAFGGTCIDLTGMSSDEDTEKCPICLNSFSSQPVATPENCQHYFCLDCILAWAKNANSCPVDRITFNSIYLRKCYGGKVKKMITVQKPVKEGQEEIIDLDLEQTSCEVCGGSDREDRLLLCDGCDAGYHMECLTPPLDSVPVEEWFCPGCQANNRHLRDSAEDISDTESLPSTARAATSRSQSAAVGPTRAIARTQQSERVRANVNRHRITQARSSQLAPTYLIQSTWLDETINAVVSGLNTAVYIRDLTPRVPSGRRRNTGKRRRKKTSSKGKAASTGVRRRRRKVRRTKSRKKLMLKKPATPRSRLANNLRITKDKKGSSLPTVYRPSEHTLSNMRADIGAASLSIYGDPFDLDPFVDREEEEQQARVTSLLEAKRRGISHSALRSHQPVARPVTASLSRRSVEAPQSTAVVEAAPVPDLLGSILSGQSVLLMDSSNVVINRDGSLKATKKMMPSVLDPGCSNSCSSGDASTQISPGMSPMQGDCSPSLHYNAEIPGSSHSSVNRPFSQSSSRLPPNMTSSANHMQSSSHSDFPPRSHPSLQPPIRPIHPPSHWRTNGVVTPSPSSSIHPTLDSSKGNEVASSQPKKGPPKPMWVDVSVLPRIPKIKRDSSGITSDGSNRSSSNSRNTNNSTSSSSSYGMPVTGMNSLAGDKVRHQSIDQHKGRADGQTQRPGKAGSSSNFSSSFASSSSTGSSASQPHYSSSSSSSSTSSSVSFRINSSGQSWQSKRLSSSSSSAAGGSTQAPRGEWEEHAKKKQLRRDKQKLLANKQQSSDNVYDPFDPTLSDSSSSGDEAESTSMVCSSQLATCERKTSLIQSKPDHGPVKTETQEEPRRASAHDATLQELRFLEEYVKVEKESRLIDSRSKTEKQTLLTTKVKKETGLDDAGEAERFGHSTKELKPGLAPPVQHNLELLKTERETLGKESGQRLGTTISDTVCKNASSASSSAPTKKKQKLETKSDSKSPKLRDLGDQEKTLKSSSSEMDRGRRGEHHTSGSQRRSRSRERRRARSPSASSRSSSPERAHGRSRRSRSKDRRRSRSGSSSSSKDRSRRKKNKLWNNEMEEGRERDCERRVSRDKRNARSRSKSRSRSRSRSLERRKDHSRPQRSSLSSRDKVESKDKRRCRSRSSSREKRKEEASSSKSSQKSSSSKHTKYFQGKKKEKDISQISVKEEKNDTVNKASSSTADPEVLKKGKDQVKEMKVGKEIKKEKQLSLDMFEDSFSFPKPIKKEETDSDALMLIGSINEEGNEPIKAEPFDIKTEPVKIKTESIQAKTEPVKIKTESIQAKTEPVKIKMESVKTKTEPVNIKTESIKTKTEPVKIKTESVKMKTEPVNIKTESIKTKTEPIKIKTGSAKIKPETFEIPIIKSEPNKLKLRPTAPVTSLTADTVSQSQAELMASREAADTTGFTAPVKQEDQQPSDSDDDFNVDMMLDSLDYVKPETADESTTSIKQEKEVEENNVQVSVAGAKSKMQVKRVTWNIQEPDGPQPEKSASKLSLYKLKLKQEGARRPSAVQTSRSTSGSASHPSKMRAAAPLSNSSRCDVQAEAEEGDLSRKDQYLKKLHMQERAIEEVKLAIKPFYQRRDINKDEYKEILRKAVQKVCHSKSGEINPVKVGNLVKAYVDKYKHSRKHKKGQVSGQAQDNVS